MNYDKPFYHRSSPSLLGRYTTRLLVGFLGSLGVMGLLLNLPVFYSSPQIGWTTQRPADPIALQEIQREDPSPNAEKSEGEGSKTAEETTEAPPPTQYNEPVASSENGTPDPPSTDRNDARRTADTTDASPEMVAALTTEDRHPQIKGGTGALYLQIHYPAAARRQEIQGRLKLEFTVDRNGEVHEIEVAKSLHPLCDSAAVKALQSVEFRPALHQGRPIPVRMSLPIRFQLRPDAEQTLHSHRTRPSSR